LENGKDIVINAPNNSKENKYVQSLKVNGETYTKSYIKHKDLANGAVLDFEMGPEPSDWGSNLTDLPDSIAPAATDGLSNPALMRDLTDQSEGVATDSETKETNLLFDNTSGTQINFESEKPWIQYEFTKEKKEVRMYTLTSGVNPVDNSESGGASPKSWVLKGSNDGENWETLDERKNENFKWEKYTRAFEIEDPEVYSYYRLEITDNGDYPLVLSEIELLSIDEVPVGLVKGIKSLVERLENEGELNNTGSKALKMHLTAVEHFEKQEKYMKVVKHMKGFNLLLEQKRKSNQLTKDAYNTLKSNADYMIGIFQ